MDAKVYIDLRIRSSAAFGQQTQRSAGLRPEQVIAQRASATLKVLHGAFSRLAGEHRFALDLPRASEQGNPISLIRVFAATSDAMLELIDAISEPLALLGVLAPDQQPRIHRVPVDFAGPWAVCSRYRIPSRHSFSRSKSGFNYRLHAMRQASERRLPFFFVDSASNGQHFVMHIQRQVLNERPCCKQSDVTPTSYGLSTKHAALAVPALDA